MALQPNLKPLIIAGSPSAPQTIDVFCDPQWITSARTARRSRSRLTKSSSPLLNQQYGGKVKIIFRNQVQPWHASSTLVHEAGIAVARVAPDQFWAFSLALFAKQDDFFDIPSSDLTVKQIRGKLADLAASVIGADKRDAVLDLLTNKSSPNGGVAVTDDLKYTIKFSRQNGIHVSPTVLFDGLVANEISSSWGETEWKEFLAKKIV
ncbi:hypothetical protein NM688_g3737 [Phlebia brevispora]|uniref:Uncharacterized protein n=1 Tax=Phlebia brevispora TaxID=194682 RepID=A0ACC1T4W7_9APHY|nr:hypothetical protein NM688_g3737 [Phlebia brevispora]